MKKQRILSFLLAMVMTVSLLPATALAAKTENFTDVSRDDWFYKYVDFVADEEYFVGTSETTFSPNMSMTRAMFVVVLAALEGVKVDNNVAPFADVPANTWYSGAVAWAAKSGVVAGVGDNKFAPDTAISREQMAVMMNAYIDWHSDKHGETHKAQAQVKSFGDADKVASWAVKAVENCRGWGLIAGAPDGNFYPQNTATRVEVATVVYNLAWLVHGGGGGSRPNKPEVKYFEVTFYNNFPGETAPSVFMTSGDIKEGESYTVTAAQPTFEGYTFAGWNTMANGTGSAVKVGDALTQATNVYAQWTKNTDPTDPTVPVVGVKQDLIFNAMKGVITDIETALTEAINKSDATVDKYMDKLPAGVLNKLPADAPFFGFTGNFDANNDNKIDFGAGNGGSQVVIDGIVLDGRIYDGFMRKQDINAVITAESDTIDAVIAKSAELAIAFVGGENTKQDVRDIVGAAVTAAKEAMGVEISKQQVTNIANKVYDKVQGTASDLNPRKLWKDNFKVDGEYITGDITLTVYGTSVTVKVDEETYVNGKKAAAIDMAVAIAKDLYNDLKDCKTYTTLDEIDLGVTVDVMFSDNKTNEHQENTNFFPYHYQLNVNMAVEGTAADNVAYKFADGHFVQIIITDEVEQAYQDAVKAGIEVVLSSADVQAYLEKHLSKDKLTDKVTDTSMIKDLTSSLESMNMANASEVVNDAVSNWVDANANTSDLANSGLLNQFMSGQVKEGQNDAIYTLIDDSVVAITTYYMETEFAAFNDPSDPLVFGDTLFTGVKPSNLENFIKNTKPDAYEMLVETGLKDYVIAKTVDTLKDKDEYVTEDVTNSMKESIDEQIFTAASDAMNEMVDNQGGNVAKYLEKAKLLKNFDTMKTLKLQNLATALRTETFQNYVANKGNSIVNRVTNWIKYIPDEASIVIGNKTITEKTLAEVRDAKTTIEACNAVADLIDVIGELNLEYFKTEREITVKYDGANHKLAYTAGLMIDFQ